MKQYKIHPSYNNEESFFSDIISNYTSKGENYGNQDRNSLRLFDFKGIKINVKSFKVPNVVNRVTYKFFRKSKARRSYEYANKLIGLGIGTPRPIAYYEFTTTFFFGKSYYISNHIYYDLTYRELVSEPNFPNHEIILRAFTRFTFDLHENGVNFLDHSPGNTLIVSKIDSYDFYLVDLNRMKFQNMSFQDRMQNFSRLSPKKEMVKVMSDEYAKISGLDFETVFAKMWQLTEEFQEKFHKKQRLKKQFKFWKK